MTMSRKLRRDDDVPTKKVLFSQRIAWGIACLGTGAGLYAVYQYNHLPALLDGGQFASGIFIFWWVVVCYLFRLLFRRFDPIQMMVIDVQRRELPYTLDAGVSETELKTRPADERTFKWIANTLAAILSTIAAISFVGLAWSANFSVLVSAMLLSIFTISLISGSVLKRVLSPNTLVAYGLTLTVGLFLAFALKGNFE